MWSECTFNFLFACIRLLIKYKYRINYRDCLELYLQIHLIFQNVTKKILFKQSRHNIDLFHCHFNTFDINSTKKSHSFLNISRNQNILSSIHINFIGSYFMLLYFHWLVFHIFIPSLARISNTTSIIKSYLFYKISLVILNYYQTPDTYIIYYKKCELIIHVCVMWSVVFHV